MSFLHHINRNKARLHLNGSAEKAIAFKVVIPSHSTVDLYLLANFKFKNIEVSNTERRIDLQLDPEEMFELQTEIIKLSY